MIKPLTLQRRAKEAEKSFLPVDSPAVLLITLFPSLKTEILSMAFFFPPHCCSSEGALPESLETGEVQSPNPSCSQAAGTLL